MLDSVYLDDLQIHDTDRYSLATFNYSQPAPRQSLVTLARRHGGLDFTERYGPRTFEIAGEAWGATHNAMWQAVDALKSRLVPGADVALKFTRTGQPAQRAYVRPASDFSFPLRSGGPFMQWSGTLVAADPRLYSDALHSETYDPSLATTGIGVSFPLTFDLTYGGSGTTANMVVDNAGTFPTPPVFTINGPATSPVIENVTTGETITTTASLASSSDSLYIDVAKREVRLGGSGGTLRPDLIDVSATTFFDLDTGTTELKLTGSGFTLGESFLLCEWRDTWI